MNTPLSNHTRSARVAVSALIAPLALVGAAAGAADNRAHGEDAQPIVVEKDATMASWKRAVSRALDRRLAAFERVHKIDPKNGVVELHFTLDEQGRAEGIVAAHSSGDARTDWLARRAVQSLTRLDEAPVPRAGARRFVARIVFADSPREKEALLARFASAKAARLADSNDGAIMLGG